MAFISASVYTSHVPAIGAALDQGKTEEPYWQPLFKGYEFSKQWMEEAKPDVIILVYNLLMKDGGRGPYRWFRDIQN